MALKVLLQTTSSSNKHNDNLMKNEATMKYSESSCGKEIN